MGFFGLPKWVSVVVCIAMLTSLVDRMLAAVIFLLECVR